MKITFSTSKRLTSAIGQKERAFRLGMYRRVALCTLRAKAQKSPSATQGQIGYLPIGSSLAVIILLQTMVVCTPSVPMLLRFWLTGLDHSSDLHRGVRSARSLTLCTTWCG